MKMLVHGAEARTPRAGEKPIECLARDGAKTVRRQRGAHVAFDEPGHFVFRIHAGDSDAVNAGEGLRDAVSNDADKIGKRMRADHAHLDLAKAGPDALVVAQLFVEPEPIPFLRRGSLVHASVSRSLSRRLRGQPLRPSMASSRGAGTEAGRALT